MTITELFSTWKGWVTTVLSTLALISAFYGAGVWFNDFVFSETEAGEALDDQLSRAMSESYARELGDLEVQMELLILRLEFFDNEEVFRPLNEREYRLIALIEQEKISLQGRIDKIRCRQDPSRDPLLC